MNSPRIYACLAGVWHDLEKDDPDCVMGPKRQAPSMWYEENAVLTGRAPYQQTIPRLDKLQCSLYEFPYVMVDFQGNSYRVQASQLQIVGE